MNNISEIFNRIIEIFDRKQETVFETETIEVTRAASAAASIYEKIRNAVELRDEHVLRRSAVERIIIRRLGENRGTERLADSLVREILWAGYLGKEDVPNSKVDKIKNVLDKYIYFLNQIKSTKGDKAKEISSWFIGVASGEIERILLSYDKEDAIVGLMYQLLYGQVVLLDEKLTQRRDIQVYLAVSRALYKLDEPFLRLALIKIFYPDWFSDSKDVWANLSGKLTLMYNEVEQEVNYPLKDRLTKYAKRMVAPFLILDEVLRKNQGKNKEIFGDEKKLTEEVEKVCKNKYAQLGLRLRRAVTRSIIYIFLTKMLIGLLIEYPYDKYILEKVQYLSLGINAIVPPTLMFLIGTSIKIPGEENTQRIINRIKLIVHKGVLFAESDKKIEFSLKKTVKRPFLTSIFIVIYLLAFVVTFGSIFWILKFLSFSPVSMAIFFFFLSAVVFFGYRVRLIAKEYILVEKENILTPLGDFFLLPILKLGSLLSAAISKINIFSFILDFIIEAQFKTIIEVVDEWIRFMREKREETM